LIFASGPKPKSQMRFTLFAALCSAALWSSLASVSNCGKNALFTITELGQLPTDSISAGDNLTLTLKYTTPVEITGGIAKTSISLNYIPFTPTSEPLCLNTPCPMVQGIIYDGSVSDVFPGGVSGTLITTITWTDPVGIQLLCIKSIIQAIGFKMIASPENSTY